MSIAKSRKTELRYHVRYFASLLVKETEAASSGYFDFLNLTHEDAEFISSEMRSIADMIFREDKP